MPHATDGAPTSGWWLCPGCDCRRNDLVQREQIHRMVRLVADRYGQPVQDEDALVGGARCPGGIGREIGEQALDIGAEARRIGGPGMRRGSVLDLLWCCIEPQPAHRRAAQSDCGRTQADRTGCVPWNLPECKSRLPLSSERAREAGVGGSGQAVAPRRPRPRSGSRKKRS